MIEKRKKRGSHVEVIISFIIFVTFVFFLFSILKPAIGGQTDKENLLDHVEVGITNRISEDMTTITIKILTSTSQNCIELSDGINNLGITSGVVAEGSLEQSLNCTLSPANSDRLQISRISASDDFLKIYSSSAFSPVVSGSSNCQILQRGSGYSLGLTKTDNYIFETKMLDLINEDYKTLKNNLEIPEGVNFGYGIVLSNGTSFESTNEELSTNIYIREKPIEYVDSRGNTLMGYLKIKIW